MHDLVRMECVLLSVLLVMWIFVLEIPQAVARASFLSASSTEHSILQPRHAEGQADAREVREQQARLSNTAVAGRQVQQENQRALIFFFLLLTGFVLLTLKQVSLQCDHVHSHGKTSIIRFIHLQDGQK
ncbi:MAG: hypothetical protein IJ747_00625 [Lachnospiraceae bacterium]|nr:hypothetical protein [Lachnospiraceae bacterium]